MLKAYRSNNSGNRDESYYTMKKIGLLLAYGLNYGAVLQAYATQKVIKNMGVDAVIISHKPSRLFRHIRFNVGNLFFLMQKLLN